MARILIIDDDPMMCQTLSDMVTASGHSESRALTLAEGMEKASAGQFDVVFLDVRMPDGNGLQVLPRIRSAPSAPEVIIMTGEGDPDGAELAIKNGAWDYVEKPSSLKRILLPLTRALQYRESRRSLRPRVALKKGDLLGRSPQWETCLDFVARAAQSEANVLITGETGTGKERLATAIHQNGPRAGKNFVVVDCAGLPENLVGSILFGHERGAFTGADQARVGLIRQADGGTLFLDEVGELPLSMQGAFLRVLQDRRFRPLGQDREVESDFRLLAATNRDMERMVREGRFRGDLLFRLRSLAFQIPPLRERREDIREITMAHTARLCERHGADTKGFSPDFFESLYDYHWPGNVRELLHTVETVLENARFEPTLFPRHLPMHIRVSLARHSVGRTAPSAADAAERASEASSLAPLDIVRRDAVDRVERKYLQDLLSVTRRDIKEACRVSGLSRSRLYHLLRKHQVSASA